MTPSDHAARAPSEAAKTSAAEIWAMFEVRGPGTLMGPNETLLAAWLDAFARSARKRALMKAAQWCDMNGAARAWEIASELRDQAQQDPS